MADNSTAVVWLVYPSVDVVNDCDVSEVQKGRGSAAALAVSLWLTVRVTPNAGGYASDKGSASG